MRCVKVGLALILLAQVWAEGQELERYPAEAKQDSIPSRKTRSIFHRPAKSSPPEQLAYAEQLAASGRLRKAGRAFDALVHTWPEAPEAVRAQMRLAETLEKRGCYQEAFQEYQYLIENFTGQYPHAAVLERQFQIAHLLMTRRVGKFLGLPGFAAPERALPLFEAVVRNGPQWERAAEAQLLIGTLHEEAGSYEEAIAAYSKLYYNYPRSSLAVEAAFRRARCEYRLAKANRRDESSCRAALSSLSAFLLNYPDHPQAAELREYEAEIESHLAQMHYERALFYDKTAKKPAAALIAYQDFLRKFPASPLAVRVQKRVTELKGDLEPKQ